METKDGVAQASTSLSSGAPVLEVEDLVVEFPVRSKVLRREIGRVHAVDGVSLNVGMAETMAVVGESGCGKSTLARTIVGMNTPERGRIVLAGTDLMTASRGEMQRQRRNVQLVFQNSYGSLNPRMRIRDIVAEPLVAYGIGDSSERRVRADEALSLVGLDPSRADRYAHEFSGGQRQRIGIARALILKPQLLILDEPVSALDVSIQAQIINLLRRLQDELGLSYLLISHDLAVVRHIAHRVAVMYLGRIVELGKCDDVFDRPTHPYTQALYESVPIPDPRRARMGERRVLEGDLPSPLDPPSGCRFRTRCWKAQELCAQDQPRLVERNSDSHLSACHFPITHDTDPD